MNITSTALNFMERVRRKLIRMEIGTQDLPKIVFVHVPKSGGSSINSAFKKIYATSYYMVIPNKSYEASNIFLETQKYLNCKHYQIGRGILLFEAAARGKKFLTGHVYYNEEMRLQLSQMGYKFITVIRRPIDRCFSNYFFNFYKDSYHFAVNSGFEEYIQNHPGIGYKYIQYYGGLRPDNDYASEEAIETALNNLKKYDIVGRLREMSKFNDQIKEEFGIRLNIPKVNKNPADREEYNNFKSNPEYRDMLREVCAPDIKLLERFNSVLKSE